MTNKKLPNEPLYKMIIEFKYTKLVMDWEVGNQLLTCLLQAEIYDKGYQKEASVKPLNSDDVSATLISVQEYKETKLNQILNPNRDKPNA